MAYEFIKGPLGASGDRNDIPLSTDPSTPNQMSYAEGTPPICSQDPNAGGQPPRRADRNQVDYLTTNNLFEFQKGLFPTFDTKMTVSPQTGYPLNAILWCESIGTFLKSTKTNNTDNFITTPAVIGVSWTVWPNPNASNGVQTGQLAVYTKRPAIIPDGYDICEGGLVPDDTDHANVRAFLGNTFSAQSTYIQPAEVTSVSYDKFFEIDTDKRLYYSAASNSMCSLIYGLTTDAPAQVDLPKTEQACDKIIKANDKLFLFNTSTATTTIDVIDLEAYTRSTLTIASATYNVSDLNPANGYIYMNNAAASATVYYVNTVDNIISTFALPTSRIWQAFVMSSNNVLFYCSSNTSYGILFGVTPQAPVTPVATNTITNGYYNTPVEAPNGYVYLVGVSTASTTIAKVNIANFETVQITGLVNKVRSNPVLVGNVIFAGANTTSVAYIFVFDTSTDSELGLSSITAGYWNTITQIGSMLYFTRSTGSSTSILRLNSNTLAYTVYSGSTWLGTPMQDAAGNIYINTETTIDRLNADGTSEAVYTYTSASSYAPLVDMTDGAIWYDANNISAEIIRVTGNSYAVLDSPEPTDVITAGFNTLDGSTYLFTNNNNNAYKFSTADNSFTHILAVLGTQILDLVYDTANSRYIEVSSLGASVLTNLLGDGIRYPDFRGAFFRAEGGLANPIGLRQNDAIRNITGVVGALGNPGRVIEGAFYYHSVGGIISNSGDPDYNAGFDASRVVPVAYENRPINMTVCVLIKL